MSAADIETVRDDWRAKMLAHGVHPALAEKWSSLVRPRIRLIPGELREADETPIGVSKLGGCPDLPVGTAWPIRPPYQTPSFSLEEGGAVEQPLRFIAQINLEQIDAKFLDLPLPDTGLLFFFYDSDVQPWGLELQDAPGSRIMYSPPGRRLRRRTPPENHPSRVRSVSAAPHYAVAPWQWVEHWINAKWPDAPFEFNSERLKYQDPTEDEGYVERDRHFVGGWPDIIQSFMEFDCEVITSGARDARPPQSYQEFLAEVARDKRAWAERCLNWRLLLQIASDEEVDFYWADLGNIYYWARWQDIARANFDNGWTILQSD